jgi:hypothetical protein
VFQKRINSLDASKNAPTPKEEKIAKNELANVVFSEKNGVC